MKEQCFSSSVSAQLSSWLSSVHPDTGWSQEHYSAALCLTEPGQILSYLTHSGPTFPEPYASFSHPIMQHMDTVYFGSMSCPFLIPSADVLLDACAKAADENLHPVLALPPVMSLDFERIQQLLDQILPRLPKHQELSVNDWGLIRYIHAHYPSVVIELGPLPVFSDEYIPPVHTPMRTGNRFKRRSAVQQTAMQPPVHFLCFSVS